ncbi:MAG TPA: aldehyde ferredoxin oxidoreductase family protein [Candidatus Lokiarchaeia archaeon]|nr:aldehyde ferredoxin oxidoreductase family protein [Candidatus Lokiarchaeia archaeon]
MSLNFKILKIDLASKDISSVPIDEAEYQKFIGGAGMAARILYPMLDGNIEPLSPQNPLLFMSGALAGTMAPNFGRHVVCARSPLTGYWGESNCGGTWGAELKLAGWDGVLLLNASEDWVYISIKDEDVEIKDATQLVGKIVHETEEAIAEELGEKKVHISSIGPAGENLVKYAAILSDDGRAAGRTGMGAVMGSKKVKAIAVIGTKKPVMNDQEKFDAAKKQLQQEIKDNFTATMFGDLGNAGYVDMAAITGDMSFKYFSQGSWDGAYDISGASMKESILKKQFFCKQCIIGCGRIVEVPDGKYQTPGMVHGPEYETIGAFGATLLCKDLKAISKANYLCNEFGIDTITGGVTIGFTYYLQEKGILPPDQVDGLELTWGDIDPAITLIEKIAKREGVGNLLAEGTVGMAKQLGISTEECAAVNGLEVPFHDARAYLGTALEYATSARGACHQTAQYYLTSMGAPFPDWGIAPPDRFDNNVAEVVAKLQDLRSVFQSLSLCNFVIPSTATLLADFFSSATGVSMDKESLILAGERITTLRRLINLKLGYTPATEKFPEILLKPLDGGTEGKVPDVEKQVQDWYSYRGWDRETGRPPDDKIEALGLASLDDIITKA